MKLLEGKTALVTGATRGIGRAIAVKFATEGANVAFTYRQINSNAEELVKEIEALGVKCKGYAADAADFAATDNVVKEVVADFGRIDILVNNAGITKDGLILRMTEEQWDAVITTNLKSAFNFIGSNDFPVATAVRDNEPFFTVVFSTVVPEHASPRAQASNAE